PTPNNFFFFQAEDGIRDFHVTGVQTCALPISFDKDEPGTSNCYDTCATNWPPLTADENAQPEGDFTLVERTDGTKQWAYKGEPLYLWVKDTKPGDATGDGVNDVWHTAVE